MFWESNIWQMVVCHVCHDVCGACGEDRRVGHGVQRVEGGRRHSHSINSSCNQLWRDTFRSCFRDSGWKNEWCHGAGGLLGKEEDFRTRCGWIIGTLSIFSRDRVFLRFRNDPKASFPAFLSHTSVLPEVQKWRFLHKLIRFLKVADKYFTNLSVSFLYLILRTPARTLGTFWRLWCLGFQPATF